ncbi:hypothetical protein SDC9_144611 [bioreactor metagenome]|uniref:Uncharacterized protein n=1 Tax=bioreactor metagenome TaxID=1076179 RepID=A0A645E885_9ZZZZ
MAGKMEFIVLYGIFIDGEGDQHIYFFCGKVPGRIVESDECRLTRFGRWRSQLNPYLFLNAVEQVDLPRAALINMIDNVEVEGAVIEYFTVIRGRFGRAVDDRNEKFLHALIGEGFQQYFVSYPVNISVSDTHFYLF